LGRYTNLYSKRH